MYSELWILFLVPVLISSKYFEEEERNLSVNVKLALLNYEARFTYAVTPDIGFEPYWEDFEQLHDPTASTYAKPVSKKETTEAGSRTAPPPTTRGRTNPKVCGEDCHFNYRSIKHVCTHHTDANNWTGCWKPAPAPHWENAHCWNEVPDQLQEPFKEFPTYCAFLDATCRNHFTAARYILLHIGKCKTVDDWFKPVIDYSAVFDRLKKYKFIDLRGSNKKGRG